MRHRGGRAPVGRGRRTGRLAGLGAAVAVGLAAVGGTGVPAGAVASPERPAAAPRTAGPAASGAPHDLRRRVAAAQEIADRLAAWQRCVAWRGLSSYGDEDGAHGYRYDDAGEAGTGYRDALALDRRGASRADAAVLVVRTGHGCRPSPPVREEATATARAGGHGLRAAVARLTRAGRRWDGWESCLAELPVAQYGETGGSYGFRLRSGATWSHAAALVADPGDDPDYVLVGVRRAGRAPACTARLRSPTRDADERDADGDEEAPELPGAIDDAEKALGGFDLFDRCSFGVVLEPVGDRAAGSGLWFGPRGRRPGVALGGEAAGAGSFVALATPGEEPPGIECHEDAAPEPDDDD